MTFVERVHAVADKGFTERQAGFLVTVMLHSGVCVRRQYCAYAQIAHGQKDHDFFASLVAKKQATSYAAASVRSCGQPVPCRRSAFESGCNRAA